MISGIELLNELSTNKKTPTKIFIVREVAECEYSIFEFDNISFYKS